MVSEAWRLLVYQSFCVAVLVSGANYNPPLLAHIALAYMQFAMISNSKLGLMILPFRYRFILNRTLRIAEKAITI